MVQRASSRGQQCGQLGLRPAGMLGDGLEHTPQLSHLQARSSDTYPSSLSPPRALIPGTLGLLLDRGLEVIIGHQAVIRS